MMKKNRVREKWDRIGAVIILALLLLLPLPVAIWGRLEAMPWLGHYQCPFRQLTGLPCAGCGMTHALWALFQGRVSEALRYNALFPLPLLVWFYLLATCAVKGCTGRWWHCRWCGYAVWAAVPLVLAFFLLRLFTGAP